MTTSLVSVLQSGMAIFVGGVLLVVGGLIWYALYRKGDVRAEFAHGKTIFKLEAKDRKSS
jgi:hypothetical protein